MRGVAAVAQGGQCWLWKVSRASVGASHRATRTANSAHSAAVRPDRHLTTKAPLDLTGRVHQRDFLQQPIVALGALELGQKARAKLGVAGGRQGGRKGQGSSGCRPGEGAQGQHASRSRVVQQPVSQRAQSPFAPHQHTPPFTHPPSSHPYLPQPSEGLVGLDHQRVAGRAPLIRAVHDNHKPVRRRVAHESGWGRIGGTMLTVAADTTMTENIRVKARQRRAFNTLSASTGLLLPASSAGGSPMRMPG